MKLPPTFTPGGNDIFTVVESAKGTANKYTYFPEQDFFKLTKVLPAGMVFPLDFGFIPGTKGDDGDPLDVLVLGGKGSFTGCVMECRVAGVIKAKQFEENKTEHNDRIIAISNEHDEYRHIHSLSETGGVLVNDIAQFFINYNKIDGKRFEVSGTADAAVAIELIRSQMVK